MILRLKNSLLLCLLSIFLLCFVLLSAQNLYLLVEALGRGTFLSLQNLLRPLLETLYAVPLKNNVVLAAQLLVVPLLGLTILSPLLMIHVFLHGQQLYYLNRAENWHVARATLRRQGLTTLHLIFLLVLASTPLMSHFLPLTWVPVFMFLWGAACLLAIIHGSFFLLQGGLLVKLAARKKAPQQEAVSPPNNSFPVLTLPDLESMDPARLQKIQQLAYEIIMATHGQGAVPKAGGFALNRQRTRIAEVIIATLVEHCALEDTPPEVATIYEISRSILSHSGTSTDWQAPDPLELSAWCETAVQAFNNHQILQIYDEQAARQAYQTKDHARLNAAAEELLHILWP